MKIEDIQKVAVLGCGNLGPGIALQFARAGYRVHLWGPREKSIARGKANFSQNMGDMLRHGFMTREEAAKIHSRVKINTDLEETVRDSEFMVEAIVEVLEAKRELYGRIEELCRREAVIASSTSTLLPTPLSEEMQHRDRFLVAHFWNPAYLAPLVEVCGSQETGREVIDLTMEILERIGNAPVLMRREILGFLGNRLMHAMNREALSLIGSGVCDAGDIDRVVHTSFGPRFANLGPMEYLDFSGLDLIRNIQGYLYGDLDNTPGVMPLVERLVEEGKLGKKSGQGLFDWSEKEDRIRENRDKVFIQRKKTL